MSATASSKRKNDPLDQRLFAERPHYATGMLLDSSDFIAEQTYHRGRLAMAVGAITGGGTLAGLRVGHRASTTERPEEIGVDAGLAVDRLGRLIELPRAACLRLQRWWDHMDDTDKGRDDLRRAAYGNVERFVSARAEREAGVGDAPALPTRAVIADIYLRFLLCEQGYTPSFASGPFDALDAVAVSRVRDAYELLLVPRHGLDDDFSGLPFAAALPTDPVERRDAAQDAVLDGWPDRGDPGNSKPLPPAEHPNDIDTSAQFIARVLIPVDASTQPQRQGEAVVVDNWARRFVPSTQLLLRWLAP